MSWDIFVQDFPGDALSVKDIPSDFVPAVIANRSAIIAKVKEIAPSADVSDPSWGRIEGDGWSVELNLGKDEECKHFALHVRGADTAAGAVAAILEHLNLRALDSQTGDFFVAGAAAVASFRKWRAYHSNLGR